MAIKYTEEQLNTVDKSLIIQMFLNQQEELSKAANQIEQLTKEVQSGTDNLPPMMKQIIPVSYTNLRANETSQHLVCRFLLEKKTITST